jgi:cobalt-zinc-cadmium efflux system outer membrane protein
MGFLKASIAKQLLAAVALWTALCRTEFLLAQDFAPARLGPPRVSLPVAAGKEAGKDKVEPKGSVHEHKDKMPPKKEHAHEPKEENPLPAPPFPRPDDKRPAISLEELEQLALQNNPTLVEAAMQIEASRAKAQQARLWPNPTVGYVAEQIGVNGTAGEFQGGFVQQEIITAFKRRLSAAKYSQQAQTAEFNALGQQLRVLNGVRMHYFKVVAASRMTAIRHALFENATEEYRTTLEEHNIGRKDKAEVLLAENRRNKARIDWLREKNHFDLMWRELAVLVGTPELTAGKLKDNLEPEGAPLDYDASLARILSESAEVLAARSHVSFEEISLKRERVEPIPNITLKGAAGYNAETKQSVADVQVGIELPLWNRNQGNIRLVQADLQRSLAEVRRVELSLQKRLAQRFTTYQDALVLVQVYQKENLPNAQQAYQVYVDQYKKRRIEWPEVIRLHRNWLMVQLEYTRSLLELRQQEVAITGLLSVDGLAEPEGPTPPGHIEVSPQPR